MDHASQQSQLPSPSPPPPPPPRNRRLAARLGRSAPRSRLGCVTCKQRHVRCDETHPSCGNCARLQLNCQYRNPRNRTSTKLTAEAEPPLRPRQHTRHAASMQPSRHSSTGTSKPGELAEPEPLPLSLGWFGDNANDPLAAGRHQPEGFDDAWGLNMHTLMVPSCPLLLEPCLLSGPAADAFAAGTEQGHQFGTESWASPAPWAFERHIQQDTASNDQHQRHPASYGGEGSPVWAGRPLFPLQETTLMARSAEAAGAVVSPSTRCDTEMDASEASPQESPPTPGDASSNPDTSGHKHLIEAFERIIHPPGGVLIGGVRRWRRLQRHLIRLSTRDKAIMNLLLCVGELFAHAMEKRQKLSIETHDRIRRRHVAATSELRQRMSRLKSGEAESGDDLLVVFFLLAWFHVLRDRGSGVLDSADLAFPSSEADLVITATTTWNWYSKQLLSWFNVLDARATHLGGDFLLSARALQTVSYYPVQVTDYDYEGAKHEDDQAGLNDSAGPSPSASPRPPSRTRPPEEGRKGCPPSPPLTACDVKKITLRFILQPGVDWYLQAIAFYRRITALDKHHRGRFTPDDEIEVMTASKRIGADLWELWAQRPSAISLSPAELAMSVSPDVAMTSAEVFSVHLATFWSLFVYLHRVSWWHLEHSKTARDALDETWSHLQASYGEVTDGGRRRIIHPSVMWPVFILGVETKDKQRQTWAVEQLAALGDPRRSHGSSESGGQDTLPGFRISQGSTRNATRASILLRAVVEKQGQLARRVDELDVARELFGAGFSLV